jgi:histidinol-phosphatase (PHP family)
MIEQCDFQIIGHVDKIVRNALIYKDFNLENKWFLDLVYETFSLIKQKDIIVEINTKSLKTKKITYPNKTFYGMLKGMHIPVMVNSDAHYPDLIMSGMEETYAELLRAGIKTVRVLNRGKWVDISIE